MRSGDQEEEEGDDDVRQDVCVDGTGHDSLHTTSTTGGHPDDPRTAHHHTTATTTATATTTTATASHLPPPPAYPCREECTRCGQDTTHDTPDTMKGGGGQKLGCSCECHHNWQPPECGGPLPPAGHTPPTGADCLPGCGYSGLPCFNCSTTLHPHPHKSPTPEEEDSHTPHPTFSPQIYTIELMERPTTNAGDAGEEEEEELPQVSRHQQLIVEKEDWNARHMGISLMSCIIFIIIFIFVFKILFKGAAGYFW